MRLAEVPPASAVERWQPTGPVDVSLLARGTIAEHLAIAELLRRGHRVAVPVVDDDGVDLLVDYRIKVQVKSSAALSAERRRGSGSVGPRRLSKRYVTFHVSRCRATGAKPYDVDVFLLFDSRNTERIFYVIPASEIRRKRTLELTPKYQAWADAWHVFGEVEEVV